MEEEDTELFATQLERLSTDELVSILRNHDEDEWPPRVFEIVASILTARGVRSAEWVCSDCDEAWPEGEPPGP